MIKNKIRIILDFPKKGIEFKDITPLLQDKKSFKEMVDRIVKRYKHKKIDIIAGVESRGFIIASAVAYKLGIGFIPIRKKGKLPYHTITVSYDLEYGKDAIQIHTDAIKPNQRVLLIDDVLATGGTALASIHAIELAEGNIVECCFLINLEKLKGRKMLLKNGYKVYSLIND